MDFTEMQAIILGFIAGYISLNFAFFSILKERKERKKNKFFKALISGLKIDTIQTINDVMNIYKGCTNVNQDEIVRGDLSIRLREFLADLISKEKYLLGFKIDKAEIVKWKLLITKLIEENEKISPFAELPDAERNNLNDIMIFLANQDFESANRKIAELSGMIKARNDDLENIKRINRYSIPLAILGLIFTAVFGFLALF